MEEKTDFPASLRKAGYKATPQRLFLLRLLSMAKRPLSPQDIISKMKKEADPVTVYRILKDLKSAGFVRQIDFQHSHAHYELSDAEDHHHLICSKCGTSEDIEGCDVEDMGKSILRKSKHFGIIQRHSLEFFGICRNCSHSGIK